MMTRINSLTISWGKSILSIHSLQLGIQFQRKLRVLRGKTQHTHTQTQIYMHAHIRYCA